MGTWHVCEFSFDRVITSLTFFVPDGENIKDKLTQYVFSSHLVTNNHDCGCETAYIPENIKVIEVTKLNNDGKAEVLPELKGFSDFYGIPFYSRMCKEHKS